MSWKTVTVLLLAGLLAALCALHTADLPPATEPASIDGPLANARIEIHKARRELLLYSGDELLRTFPIGLGFDPVSPKVRQGDGATPEGDYFVCVKNPNSSYYLSLGINYPNREDAARGLGDGLVSRSQHDRIARAEERRICPPWNTSLGGEIFIHGSGSSADWTLGCAALDNPDMKELFSAASVGTQVIIKP